MGRLWKKISLSLQYTCSRSLTRGRKWSEIEHCILYIQNCSKLQYRADMMQGTPLVALQTMQCSTLHCRVFRCGSTLFVLLILYVCAHLYFMLPFNSAFSFCTCICEIYSTGVRGNFTTYQGENSLQSHL